MTNLEDSTGWHLDKRVPITFIVVLLGYGITGMWTVAELKRDVEVLKAQVYEQRIRDQAQDQATRESFSQLRGDVRELTVEIRRLSERVYDGPPIRATPKDPR